MANISYHGTFTMMTSELPQTESTVGDVQHSTQTVIEKFSFKIPEMVVMQSVTRGVNTKLTPIMMFCMKPIHQLSNHTHVQTIIFSNGDLQIMKITSIEFELFFKRCTQKPNFLVETNTQQWLLRRRFLRLLQGIQSLTIQITGRDLEVNVYVRK